MRFTRLLKKVLRIYILSAFLMLLGINAKLPAPAYGSDSQAPYSTIRKDIVLIIALDSKRDAEGVQEALLGFAAELRQNDRLSVIVAGSHPRVALGLRPIGESSIVVSQINRLHPQGNQNIFIAYSLALAELNSAAIEGRTDEQRARMLVLLFEPPYPSAYFGINDLIGLSTLASQRLIQTNIYHLGQLADSKFQAVASAGNGKTIVISKLAELNLDSMGISARSEIAAPLESNTNKQFLSQSEALDRSSFPIEDVLCGEPPVMPTVNPLTYCDKFWTARAHLNLYLEQSRGL